MTDRGSSGMPDVRVEQGADEAAGVGQVAIAGGAEECAAGRRLDEAEQCPERRGLTGAIGAEETDDRSALHGEADVDDGLVSTVGLCELIDGDDGVGGALSGGAGHVRFLSEWQGRGRAPASLERGRGRLTGRSG